jgi:hypothetical protein
MIRRNRESVELAKQRWALAHPFDLEDATWEEVFNQYRPGEILQAIRLSALTVSTDPAIRFEVFERHLKKLAEEAGTRAVFLKQ